MHPVIMLQRQLTEMYEKEKKYFKPYTNFRPNPKAQSVTAKFYSRYDSRITEPNLEYVEMIKHAEEKIPQQKLSNPETVNQEYGWYTEPIIERDISDKRMHHGRIIHSHTKTETTIKQCTIKR